ncbi:MAG TPA: class I SAM-dependent methyltransferase [Verrucomicrobiae bacterium]|nr:class I SAM-dependent methyltransferase [Verrucomicrobiae bacterium]
MTNPFGTPEMAAGYASSRPPVHPRVIEIVYRRLGRTEPFAVALDVGCGAGVSTAALHGFARRAVGLEPMESMLRFAAKTAPFAAFLAGTAEAIPLQDSSADVVTAAGSLNYVDLDRFFPEALRVLKPNGVLVVYDFSPGRSFRGAPGLDEWFSGFFERYPPPRNQARQLSPAILAQAGTGFRLCEHEAFEIGIVLTPAFYLDYILTETNVADAVRNGMPYGEIRAWCSETLAPVFDRREREVLFRGYFACLRR